MAGSCISSRSSAVHAGLYSGTLPAAAAGAAQQLVKQDRELYLLLEPGGAAGGSKDSSSSFSQPLFLENIDEDYPMLLPTYPAPETPQEPMEFLSRSWSISSVEIARALAAPVSTSQALITAGGDQQQQQRVKKLATSMVTEAASAAAAAPYHSFHHSASLQDDNNNNPILETAPFTFASSMTSQLVMERIMTPGAELSPFTSHRNSHSGGTLGSTSPRRSPRQTDDYKFQRSFSMVRTPTLRVKSMGRWIKDLKEKRKEANRSQNAQVHAAVTVAGVASAIAAVTAATAAFSPEDSSSKISMAVASAAALVAAQCVELAESMGADREHMAAIVSSAVNVRTAGDIMTLTASAATALRGAATLKARTSKDSRSLAAVTPYDRGSNGQSISFSGELMVEDSEAEMSCQEHLARGAEFLKCSKKGELQWRVLFVYVNKLGQVIVKVQSKHMGGAYKKNKKSTLLQVYPDIPAWPGRNLLENSEKHRYFALKTSSGDVEFECKNAAVHQLWTTGIACLLYTPDRHLQRCSRLPYGTSEEDMVHLSPHLAHKL